MNQGDEIPEMVPNRLIESLADHPCRFDFSLLIESDRYEYGFACDASTVSEEWLYIKPLASKRPKRVFTRQREATTTTKWEWGGVGARDRTLLEAHTRANGLVLSRAAELNIEPFSTVYRWFTNRVKVVDNANPDTLATQVMAIRTAGAVQRNHTFRNRLTKLLRAADLGLSDIRVDEQEFHIPERAPRELRSFIRRLERENGLRSTELVVSTVHQTDSGNDIVFDLKKDESAGTRRWFDILGFLIEAMDDGCLVVIDELDCSLHPLLTEKIVGLFNNPDVNSSGAQLLFTSHDVTLLRPDLLRRDQVWLVERGSKQQSELFSLYDLSGANKPRSNENWARDYLRGVYGAVPILGQPLESASGS